MTPPRMGEDRAAPLTAHVPGEGQSRSQAEAQAGGGLAGARLGRVEPEPQTHGQVSEAQRILDVRGQGPPSGRNVQPVHLYAAGVVLPLAGAATRAVVEEARRTRKGERAVPGVEPPFHAGLDSLEAEHAVGTAGQPDAAPCLLECARAYFRGERAGCAVGDPAREVQAAGRVRWFPGSGRRAPVLQGEAEVEGGAGSERVDPADPRRGARARGRAARPTGTAKAVGGLGPAAGEDEEGEPVRGARPAHGEREALPGAATAGEAWLGRGKPHAGRLERQHGAETACGDWATENAGGAPGPARRGDRSLESVGDDWSGEPDRGRPGREHGRCPAAGDRPARCDEPVVEGERLGPSEPAQAYVRRRGDPPAARDGQQGREEGTRGRADAKAVHGQLALEGQRMHECPRERRWTCRETLSVRVVVAVRRGRGEVGITRPGPPRAARECRARDWEHARGLRAASLPGAALGSGARVPVRLVSPLSAPLGSGTGCSHRAAGGWGACRSIRWPCRTRSSRGGLEPRSIRFLLLRSADAAWE